MRRVFVRLSLSMLYSFQSLFIGSIHENMFSFHGTLYRRKKNSSSVISIVNLYFSSLLLFYLFILTLFLCTFAAFIEATENILHSNIWSQKKNWAQQEHHLNSTSSVRRLARVHKTSWPYVIFNIHFLSINWLAGKWCDSKPPDRWCLCLSLVFH